MVRYQQYDLVNDLVDLISDVTREIQQQMLYYQASVYKQEAADLVKSNIEQLRMIANTIGHDGLVECMNDYDAMTLLAQDGNHFIECSFTARIGHLLNACNKTLDLMRAEVHARHEVIEVRQIVSNVERNRKKILAMGRHGSRYWNFFANL